MKKKERLYVGFFFYYNCFFLVFIEFHDVGVKGSYIKCLCINRIHKSSGLGENFICL